MTDFVNLMDQIAGVVGVPCVLVIAWLIYDVKNLKEKVKALEAKSESVEKELDSKLSAVYDKLNAIASDVAWLRGVLGRKGLE